MKIDRPCMAAVLVLVAGWVAGAYAASVDYWSYDADVHPTNYTTLTPYTFTFETELPPIGTTLLIK
jgi:hypothetical protein